MTRLKIVRTMLVKQVQEYSIDAEELAGIAMDDSDFDDKVLEHAADSEEFEGIDNDNLEWRIFKENGEEIEKWMDYHGDRWHVYDVLGNEVEDK